MNENKTCVICHQTKAIEDFVPRPGTQRRRSWCKACYQGNFYIERAAWLQSIGASLKKGLANPGR